MTQGEPEGGGDPTRGQSLSGWTPSQGQPAPPPDADGGITPGTMLAGRYRVVSRLGRGGMGEVYRADDTKLGHPVALKFLRGAVSPELLSRLYAEVRIGRQVSHPNVCRLYDIVEVDGQTYLAMEYVDGEDLASLLARIGRLPPDKALDIAHDLCAGLAAVHDKGVVHRDLKPANVMIDGRGRARLTDFGLALAVEQRGPDTFGGTPAYMAPEQLLRQELTSASDIYALGLLLYEMFSGRRFFDAKTLDDLQAQHRESKAPRLSSVARLLDPAVERVILRCLDEDAAGRPASARAVRALLPGRDPLEAIVAAGETPSPEMVAAAEKRGDLGPLAAWACLFAVLGGMALTAEMMDRTGVLSAASLPKPPDVLVERARDVLSRIGYDDPPADSASSFEWNDAYAQFVLGQRLLSDAKADPAGLFSFYYRQSPRSLIPANRDGRVTLDDPPATVSGMARVVLSAQGRLTGFLAVPPQVEASDGDWPEPDWSPLFAEAGLEPGTFQAVRPQWAAPVDSDRKAAWTRPMDGRGSGELRVEAAAYHGRPVWFAVLPPWSQPSHDQASLPRVSPTPVSDMTILIFALAMPVGGVILARRNLRLGRGDRQGAFRIAVFVFATYSVARFFRADHLGRFRDELWLLIKVLAYPSFWAAQVWLLYMALEPYVRRRWPHVLISWKRLLAGNLRDPLVGRDMLMGAAAGTFLMLSFFGAIVFAAAHGLGPAPHAPAPFADGATLTSFRHVGFRLFVNQFSAVLFAMAYLFMLVLFRVVLRTSWLAVPVWCVLLALPVLGQDPTVEWVAGAMRALVLLLVLTRGGLLALATALFYMFITLETPFTLHLSAWYAPRALPVVVALAGLALFAFYTSLAGKPLFGRALLED